MVREAAKKCKAVYQESAAHRASGGTDAARLQLNRSGVATCLISIPNRYMHSPVEVIKTDDIEAVGKLLAETILAMFEEVE